MVAEQQKMKILEAVKAASLRWRKAFNGGDATGCAAEYEDDAVMHAQSFGTFTGSDEIRNFWDKFISDGFTDVEYINPVIEVIDEQSAILKSGWKMNKAAGVIHEELWVLQVDGTAKLRRDDFEARDEQD